MNGSNQNFRLNDDAKRRINEEYGYAEQQPVRRPPRSKRNIRPQSRRAVPPKYDPVYPQYTAPVSEGYDPYGYDSDPDEEFSDNIKKNKKRKKLKKFLIGLTIFCVVVILLNIIFLYYRGQIWFNEPRKRDYPVRGAVVTQELGKIDWDIMSRQTISFTYIRATRGTTSVDKQFSDNRKGAVKTDLMVGFWHEFDFRTDGGKQAENFIEQCGESMDGKLRPMVKLTKYGIYNLKMKSADEVVENLQAFLDRLEEQYGRRPVIMCDSSCYEKYVKDYFDNYTLWMIDHFGEPDEETNWAMWEYNPRVRSDGYENSKEYYPMSVFRKEKDIENFKKNLMM